MPETQNLSLPVVELARLFTTYSRPEHLPGTEHATKAEADADD